MVPFDRPHDFLLVFYCNYRPRPYMSLSCTVNEILSLISQHLKRSNYSKHTRLLRDIMPSITNSKDMIGGNVSKKELLSPYV